MKNNLVTRFYDDIGVSSNNDNSDIVYHARKQLPSGGVAILIDFMKEETLLDFLNKMLTIYKNKDLGVYLTDTERNPLKIYFDNAVNFDTKLPKSTDLVDDLISSRILHLRLGRCDCEIAVRILPEIDQYIVTKVYYQMDKIKKNL